MTEHRWMWLWLLAKAAGVVLVFVLLARSVLGQELHHPAAGQPDPFSSWRDGTGTSCCGGSDCVAADECHAPGGGEGWLELGVCWPLPPDRWVPAPREAWLHEPHRGVRVCRTRVGYAGAPVGMIVLCWDRASAS